MPSIGVELLPISGLLLRRAVLGILLAAGEPLTAQEVADTLHRCGATTKTMLLKGPSRVIADLLAYQARMGKVRKVGPALFGVIPTSMSRSTRWRCLHWRNELEALRAAVADLPPHAHWPSSPLSDAATPANRASERGELKQTVGHGRDPGPYAPKVPRINHASLADLDDLVALESNLFNEDAAHHDTHRALSLEMPQAGGRD